MINAKELKRLVLMARVLWRQDEPADPWEIINALPLPDPDERSIAGYRSMILSLHPRRGRGGDRKSDTNSRQTSLIRMFIRFYDDANPAVTGWGGPLERFVS